MSTYCGPAFVLHPGDTGRDETEKASVSRSLHLVQERQTQPGKQIRGVRYVKSTGYQTNGDARERGWRSLAGVVREILSEERKFDQDPKVGCLQPLEDPGEKCVRQTSKYKCRGPGSRPTKACDQPRGQCSRSRGKVSVRAVRVERRAGAPLRQACFRVRGKDLGCLGSNSRKPQQGFQQESEPHSFQDSPCLFRSIRAGELVMAGRGSWPRRRGEEGTA